jgi:hypothetical protein
VPSCGGCTPFSADTSAPSASATCTIDRSERSKSERSKSERSKSERSKSERSKSERSKTLHVSCTLAAATAIGKGFPLRREWSHRAATEVQNDQRRRGGKNAIG